MLGSAVGLLRPRLRRWLAGSRRGRRLERPASLGLMVLLRLALIPMTLVNAACALSPTAPPPPGRTPWPIWCCCRDSG